MSLGGIEESPGSTEQGAWEIQDGVIRWQVQQREDRRWSPSGDTGKGERVV